MKPTRAKLHLLDVDEPLLAFHDLTVRCGLTLRNAEPKFMWSEDFNEYIITPMGTCRQCLNGAPVGEAKRQYCYGLTEAQESLTEDAA